MLNNLLNSLFGNPNDREVARLNKIVQKINEYELQYQALTDEALQAKTQEFRERLAKGETEDQILPEAFAVVKNAARRLQGKSWKVREQDTTWEMVHYDCQLVGGLVLHHGRIAEMKTGEGKTLVATCPLYLNALSGKGAWLVTVNEYLAQRDAEWMGGLYKFLGLTVGVIVNAMTPAERQKAYACDIIYGTNNEFGFDYLRDNMATDPKQIVQRELHYCIVDEVDSILIDEARTPLIISAPDEASSERYQRYAQIIPQLVKGTDFTIDEKARAAMLTEIGIHKLERILGVSNIYEEAGYIEVHHLEQALKAYAVFQRDKDYVVKDGEVMIVDEFTGRMMPGRRYSDGLHQAIEAKEGVEVQRESRTLATITFQNLFRLFDKLAGMTGTALTEAEEFDKIYKLEVTVIPTNRPVQRKDLPDKIYKTESAKFQAIAHAVKEMHEKGQPVLVGTVSVERSEALSRLFAQMGIPHNVLNAKQHEREAEIVAKAGEKGAVTIATNMAGRGTDIKPAPEVKELGGLMILGSERHESRRIDNQLRGRSGRQGDPGMSQFFVSMEDALMRIFGGDSMKRIMERLKVPDNEAMESKMLSKSIEQAQKRVEGHHFDIRKHLVDYDDVISKHREIIYSRRRKILFHDSIREEIDGLLREEGEDIVLAHAVGKPHDWEREKIVEDLQKIVDNPELLPKKEQYEEVDDPRELTELSVKYLQENYAAREKQIEDQSVLRQIERQVYLRTLDRFWMEHIDMMASLREGIGLRGYAQRDPLIEYKSEGFSRFKKLLADISHGTVVSLFKVRIDQVAEMLVHAREAQAAAQAKMMRESKAQGATDPDSAPEDFSAEGGSSEPSEPTVLTAPTAVYSSPVKTQTYTSGSPTVVSADQAKSEKPGRNDPCPCGSGKKYKKCCGADE